jgi:hypothetical protein
MASGARINETHVPVAGVDACFKHAWCVGRPQSDRQRYKGNGKNSEAGKASPT